MPSSAATDRNATDAATSGARTSTNSARKSSALAAAFALSATVAVSFSSSAAADDAAPSADPVADSRAGRDSTVEPIAAPTVRDISEFIGQEEFAFDDGMVRASDPIPDLPASFEDAHAEHADDGFDNFKDEPQHALSASDVFSLHTNPSSSRKIFLDFNGHVTVDTPWNDSDQPIVSGSYSREPSGSRNNTFSQSELDGIYEIWARVADDFAPWDVDVTTADPGVDGLIRSTGSDDNFGIRVVISKDSAWYGPYGGSAYLHSFGKTYDLPAFVFSSNLANGNPKSVAEAASHEIGHTFGLRHDGIAHSDGTGSSYYSGHGNWAPIMGVGYSKELTQWSRGEYSGATNTEDDLAAIDAYIERVPTTSGSTPFGSGDSVTTHTIANGGSISTHTLEVTEGPISINVSKTIANGNLLADLAVMNSNDDVVASAAPDNSAAWSLSANLPASIAPGTYTVAVRSIGSGSASNGFTNYGSIGSYTLAIDVPGTTVVTPTTDPQDPKDDPRPPTTEPPVTPPSADQVGDRVTPMTPARLLDTRAPGAAFNRLQAGERIRIYPTQLNDVDNNASAVIVNVAAVNPSAIGFVSITPCNGARLATSSLNYGARRNIGNSVITPLATDGSFCVDASTATDLIIDVTGWIGANGATALDSIGSQRVVDSRTGVGLNGQLRPGVRTVIPLGGAIDPTTKAVSINVTAVNPDAGGFLTVNDCMSTSTTTSSLNFAARETRGNNGIFALSSNQSLCVTSSARTHITIGVTGEYAPGDGLTFVAATPARILDTRGGNHLAAGASTSYGVPRPVLENGLTVTPAAASVNIAAARHTTSGHITAWNCSTRPDTSAVNVVPGAPTANSALVSLSSTGRSCLFHASGGDLIVDLAGWWV